jgi:molybdopterin/thiamine biosynthesis adenylyltransferase
MLPERKLTPKVFVPIELLNSNYHGILLGYSNPESSTFNILSTSTFPNSPLYKAIGKIYKNKPKNIKKHKLFGFREGNDLLFYTNNEQKCEIEIYESKSDIFSRNSGILESSKMLEKGVIICGCGSVGSLVALELARSGVGHFLLIDNDTLSYSNICRHQCGVDDVGRYKVNAIKDKILNINPQASIQTKVGIVENTEKKYFDDICVKSSIIVGCGDNRESDIYANHIAKLYKIPFVSIGFWERAFAGEIFYTSNNNTPCYKCFHECVSKISGRMTQNRRLYTFEEHLEKTRFEPGISVDINFVTIIGIKLILDLLNADDVDYIPKVINSLTQFTLICNTNDERIGGEMAEIFSHPLQVTTSIEVPFQGNCESANCCKLHK